MQPIDTDLPSLFCPRSLPRVSSAAGESGARPQGAGNVSRACQTLPFLRVFLSFSKTMGLFQ